MTKENHACIFIDTKYRCMAEHRSFMMMNVGHKEYQILFQLYCGEKKPHGFCILFNFPKKNLYLPIFSKME
jgi:hypothetical protein